MAARATAEPAARRTSGQCAVAWALGVGGLVCVLSAVVGALARRRGLLVLEPVTSHPFLLLCAGSVLGLLVVWRWRRGWAGVTGLVALATLAGVSGLVGAVATWANAGFGETRSISPDGRAVLVVTEGVSVIDPLWDVSVKERSGVVARLRPVACFNGDDPDNSLTSATWVSANQVRLVAGSGQEFLVTVDLATGQPREPLSIGCDA